MACYVQGAVAAKVVAQAPPPTSEVIETLDGIAAAMASDQPNTLIGPGSANRAGIEYRGRSGGFARIKVPGFPRPAMGATK